MGNCFGKQSSDSNFETPGRTLGAAPAASQPGNAPAAATYTPTPSQGRTLSATPNAKSSDPKTAAARAAEERAKAAQGKGKLARQLDAQKSQTHGATLAEASKENRAVRDADASTAVRNWE